ncbi:aminoacyl-tRNA hydrolase [Campylobacter lari]|uniref:aminoacyl-tRNA hydrolase n=1 Tax=unclassified Campylobacter TaxID=2593542 RepID=UPI001270D28E|nr:aminoacyl-tRNA hydrolase [Campylobacter sp. RKI_CA19_01121]EAH4571503.1 aminoacyl-tRNA hydrolase [Campylobacter lari]MCR8705517.1 aminoacyl-tRNA hydrolase [Campylobacter sp. 2352 PW]EAI5466548.1 aminoacyl-tRNA hydrolase [Campylobacter lari]EAI7262599.1 aminoacyl-tRNA hydrolase [Campylobacter lari]EAK0436690.1 aminoacyl-tRNA hydrolase [Campylobacter lari]
MTLVVGLGNIGEQYAQTRHNVGFMLIDLILKDLQTTKLSNTKFKGELFKSSSTLFLKPSTYMNLSGESVKAVSEYYKCDRIIVIHDDIDLNLGALKFKIGGSSGGHNGLKSIDNLCGNAYERVRIGVGKGQDVISHVLGKFKQEEQESLTKVLEHSKKALFELLNSDIEKIASKYSLKS